MTRITAPPVVLPANGKSGFCDPAFASNKWLPMHRWVPWIAGFSSEFVGRILEQAMPQPGVVLDPFSGVGTTLVEAVLQQHRAIGFEINPYAALASRVKANAATLPLDSLRLELDRFRKIFSRRVNSNYRPRAVAPPGFRSRSPFFSPKVLRQVLIFQDFVATLEDDRVKDVFRLAFGSTLVQYSNYSYEPSLSRRVSVGKSEILDYPVAETLLAKLQIICEDIGWLRGRLQGQPAVAQIIEASFFKVKEHLPPASVDAIITSPPYLNNYHYNRNTRPQLYWLGLVNSPQDMTPLERANFGTFWQTVREEAYRGLEFELPGSDLQQRLDDLRQRQPAKGIYGGNGWANYAAAYFNDCRHFAEGMRYVLKPGGRAFVVIGNSILQGLVIPTDQYFGQIATALGLEVVRIDIPRATRVGNSIIQSEVRVSKAKDSDQLYEAIVELKQPPV